MFKKRLRLVLFILICLQPFSVMAVEKYITDDLSIYLRRGPGTQYGLIGSLNAGDKVTVLEASEDGKYTRIKDARNRISWVESEQLSSTQSLKEQIPTLKTEIEHLTQKINAATQQHQDNINRYIDQLSVANTTINELQTTNQALQEKVSQQQEKIQSLSNIVDTNGQQLMLTWFLYGGLVAGLGLILGLILPLAIPKRRNKDRWMN